MSILTGKNVLVVGDETTQIHDLENVLASAGMEIHATTCDKLDIETIEAKHVDVVLLNHLHEGSSCMQLLNSLRSKRLNRVLPIFALVEHDEEKIQGALMLGAADYFTPDESMNSIVEKMRMVLGEDNNDAVAKVIDITPDNVEASESIVRVYLIEDDTLLRNLLGMRFSQANFAMEVSEDGKNIVEKLLAFKPDVIILDLMLPGISGFDILEEIKANDALKSKPVIIFSNRDGYEDRKRTKELGASHFYVKAMTDLSQLVKTIQIEAKK